MSSWPSPDPGVHKGGRGVAPLWRDEGALRFLLQACFLAGAILVAWYFIGNMVRELERIGLGIRFGFLRQEAGFGISEGIAYDPSDSYGRALWVGAVNTLRVVAAAIACATV